MEIQPIKESKPSKLDKLVKVSIIAGALTVALSVTYYLVIFLPQKERIKIEQQKEEQTLKEQCASWALDEAQARGRERHLPEGRYNGEQYEHYFERCLREKGL